MNDNTATAEQPKARRVTVSGDIGEYQQGQVLKGDDAIAGYYRRLYNEDPIGGIECKLTDAQLLEVVDSIPGDGEDVEMQRCEKIEELAHAGD